MPRITERHPRGFFGPAPASVVALDPGAAAVLAALPPGSTQPSGGEPAAVPANPDSASIGLALTSSFSPPGGAL